MEVPKPFFNNFLYLRKYDLICLPPYHWQPCISQFCDITKGIILQNFLQIKKRDYQLPAVSCLAITNSENLAIITGTCKPRLPELIYSTPFVISQNCEKQDCQWYEVKRIKTYFRE